MHERYKHVVHSAAANGKLFVCLSVFAETMTRVSNAELARKLSAATLSRRESVASLQVWVLPPQLACVLSLFVCYWPW